MEGAATACAKAIATTIPIAMPVSSVFREMDTRLFLDVLEAGKGVGIIVSRKSMSSIRTIIWAATLTACARVIATTIPIVKRV